MRRANLGSRRMIVSRPSKRRSTSGFEIFLRVRPETLYGITKPSQHEANGSEAQERQRCSVEVLPIFGEPSATVEPRDCAFNDPTTWEHHKLVSGLIGSLDDFGFDMRQDFRLGLLELWSLIACICKKLFQEGIPSEEGG